MAQKIKYTFILLIIFISITKAQTLNALIEQKGYYNFKLGDDYAKWKSKLSLLVSFPKYQKSYLYKSKISSDFFSYDVSNLILTFNRNQKLTGITIDLGSLSPQNEKKQVDFEASLKEFGKLAKILKSAYGNKSEYNANADKGIASFTWKTKDYFLTAKITLMDDDSGKITVDFGLRSFFEI